MLTVQNLSDGKVQCSRVETLSLENSQNDNGQNPINSQEPSPLKYCTLNKQLQNLKDPKLKVVFSKTGQ